MVNLHLFQSCFDFVSVVSALYTHIKLSQFLLRHCDTAASARIGLFTSCNLHNFLESSGKSGRTNRSKIECKITQSQVVKVAVHSLMARVCILMINAMFVHRLCFDLLAK